MGVRYLNKFISNRCSPALMLRMLSDYEGQTIVVDTSIYMYKYIGENTLMESMYFMMAQFRYYNITPIFVFDGAAPIEKHAVLRNREANKVTAEMKYNDTASKLREVLTIQRDDGFLKRDRDRDRDVENDDNEYRRAVLEHERAMRGLRRRFVRVHSYELSDVKRLMRAFDMRYVEANGEADIMCAQLVKSGIAHACMSDDMDMFLYGCPRVLRYINLIHGTCVEYDLHRILELLGVSLVGLRKICILSGTDYNTDNFDPCMKCKIYLSDIYESYLEFMALYDGMARTDDDICSVGVGVDCESDIDGTSGSSFYEWMKQTNWMFHHIDVHLLSRVFGLFSAELTDDQLLNLDNVLSKTTTTESIPPKVISQCENCDDDARDTRAIGIPIRVKKIMAQYNFIFI